MPQSQDKGGLGHPSSSKKFSKEEITFPHPFAIAIIKLAFAAWLLLFVAAASEPLPNFMAILALCREGNTGFRAHPLFLMFG